MSQEKFKDLKDPALEDQLAALALQVPAVIDQDLCPVDIFTDPQLSDLIAVVTSLRFENETITPENVFAHSNNDALSLRFKQLVSRGLPGVNAKVVSDRLRQLEHLRQISRACSSTFDKCYTDDADPSEIAADLEGDITSFRSTGGNGIHSGSDISILQKTIEWRAENPKQVQGIRLGFPKIESMINGLVPGLHLIAARPSVGKTALATTWVTSMLERFTVPIVFSLEMNKVLLQERILASKTGVASRVTTERAYTDDELKKLATGMAWMKNQKWHIQDDSKIDFPEIVSQIRRLKNSSGIDAVFIDYLQLVRYKKFRKEGKRIEVGEVSGGLKRLSEDIGIPIIALAQLKRKDGFYDRALKRTIAQPPELEDLKESGDLEQDADSVFILDRDQKTNSTECKFIIAKQRNGPTGQVWLDYNPSTTRFTEAKTDL